MKRTELALSVALVVTTACEERSAPPPDASVPAPPPVAPPPREGCARVGSIEGIETDTACVLHRVNEEAMRASTKNLALTITTATPEVIAAGMAVVTLTIKNTSSVETLVVFEARTRPPGPRMDWSRMLGVPEPHGATLDTPKLFFPMTTTDAADRDVDALPTVTNASSPPPPTTLGVHLRAGGKLTHILSWWALHIPAAPPIFEDDAGHRYTPKTSALPLNPGEYGIVVELPLYGLSREERKLSTRIRVVRAPKLDGGPS